MLYIIGLGLNVDGISKYGLEIIRRCKRVYLESYTVDFPYTFGELEAVVGKKLIKTDRKFTESLALVDEARKIDVVLLVYGSPLTATTHITLINEAKHSGVKTKIIYNASVFDAAAETGLQLYKFGKIASMPAWNPEKNFTPDSFMRIIQENLSMKAHSLILVDIGLDFQDALKQLETSAKNHKISLKKIAVCSRLGTKHSRIIYKDIDEFKDYKNIRTPYCIVIPSKLHFVEKEFLKRFEK